MALPTNTVAGKYSSRYHGLRRCDLESISSSACAGALWSPALCGGRYRLQNSRAAGASSKSGVFVGRSLVELGSQLCARRRRFYLPSSLRKRILSPTRRHAGKDVHSLVVVGSRKRVVRGQHCRSRSACFSYLSFRIQA